ncbi:MAG: hypothetical protein R3E79_49775 [Caldilineaceae bacterium]
MKPRPKLRLCLERIARFQIENLWVSDDDCRFNLPRVIPDGRVDMFHILFPDPWWKPQHKVKRLFSPPFVDLLAAKLQPGGLLHFKSDVEEYGKMVCALVEAHPDFAPMTLGWPCGLAHLPLPIVRIGANDMDAPSMPTTLQGANSLPVEIGPLPNV